MAAQHTMPQPAQYQPLHPENLHDTGLSKDSALLSYPPEHERNQTPLHLGFKMVS